MRRDVITSALAIVVLTVGLGLAYPLAVTGVSQVAFPGRANGSKLERGGRLAGSRLLAQDPGRDVRSFHPRPSTATKYNPAATAFTNLGPNSKAAQEAFKANLAGYLARERRYDPGLTAARVPVDPVTSSASGVAVTSTCAKRRTSAGEPLSPAGPAVATIRHPSGAVASPSGNVAGAPPR